MARGLTDEERQELGFEDYANRAAARGGVWIDDLNPEKDPDQSSDRRDLRVRAFVLVGGILWATYATIRARGADNKAVVAALSMKPVWPEDQVRDAALTARLLQRVPVGLLVRLALEKADEESELDAWAAAYGLPTKAAPEEAARIRKAADELGVKWAPPRGNRGTPRVFYDAFALDVVEIARQGLAVVPEMARRRGRDESTIKRWIRDARDVYGSLDRRRGVWKLGPNYGRQEGA